MVAFLHVCDEYDTQLMFTLNYMLAKLHAMHLEITSNSLTLKSLQPQYTAAVAGAIDAGYRQML